MAPAKSIDIAVLRQRLRDAVKRLKCGLCHPQIMMAPSKIVRGFHKGSLMVADTYWGMTRNRGESTQT